MGRRTPGRRVPPRGPGRPDPRRPAPRRPDPRRPDRSAPSPRTTPSLGAIGPAVMAAAKDKGMVKGKGIGPKPGSFESMLNALEQQKKEAQAKTGSSALSPKQIAETMVNEKAKSGTTEEVDAFRDKLEEIQGRKEEERAGTYSDAFRADLTKKINDEIKREEQIKAEKTGITKEGRSDFNYDAFKAKLEEIQRRKEEGKPVFKGIRGGARPVRRTGGKPRTVRRTGGRPAPFFSPRPTRPPVRYGMRPGGIFGPMFGAIDRGLGRR